MTPALPLKTRFMAGSNTMHQSTVAAKESRLIVWKFQGYLNRQGAAKEEIGQYRLSLDLAEYVGCDNRNETIETQKN